MSETCRGYKIEITPPLQVYNNKNTNKMKKSELWQNPLDKGLNPVTMWSRDIIQEQNNNNDE